MQKNDSSAVIKLAQYLFDRKAQQIELLNVTHLTILTDYLLIASGTNSLHVKALAEYIDSKAMELGFELRRQEGYNEGRWVVLDYNYFVIHLFHPEDREYYRLDKLWEDGTNSLDLHFLGEDKA
ncbi:MAG TPA: ribosome silencing factor [Christensenellaceae bacterium]|jgi:ribosome-associated protein|nr:ribosome silencing factor [Christensenellaceae bacterium]